MQRQTIKKMKEIKIAAMKAAKMGELDKVEELRQKGFSMGMCINRDNLCDDERCYCHEDNSRN
jgi:hypothetical protein